MPLSSVDRIPPNPFSREFREMFAEMREEIVGLLEQRQAIEEALERPWPYFERGAATTGGIHAIVLGSVSLPDPIFNQWQYTCRAAIGSPGMFVVDPEGEIFADVRNLIEQLNDATTVSHGVDVADTPEFTVEVLAIKALTPVLLSPSPGPGHTFSEPNAINFTCVTP